MNRTVPPSKNKRERRQVLSGWLAHLRRMRVLVERPAWRLLQGYKWPIAVCHFAEAAAALLSALLPH